MRYSSAKSWMVRTRSWRTSSRLLNPSSSSRRRFCSAALAIVFELLLLDSRTRLPANQNSYHQTFPRFSRDIALYLALYLAELNHFTALSGAWASGLLAPPVGKAASHDSISSGR